MNGASVSAKINPGALPAEYYFEYGTHVDQLLKTPLRQLAGSTEFLPVTEELSGLQERTSYLFRIVAHNASGTNQQFGTFATRQFSARIFQTRVTNGIHFLKTGDFDGDGRMDFVGANQDGYGASLFWNSGTGFESITNLRTNVPTAELLDWDNGGRASAGGTMILMAGRIF